MSAITHLLPLRMRVQADDSGPKPLDEADVSKLRYVIMTRTRPRCQTAVRPRSAGLRDPRSPRGFEATFGGFLPAWRRELIKLEMFRLHGSDLRPDLAIGRPPPTLSADAAAAIRTFPVLRRPPFVMGTPNPRVLPYRPSGQMMMARMRNFTVFVRRVSRLVSGGVEIKRRRLPLEPSVDLIAKQSPAKRHSAFAVKPHCRSNALRGKRTYKFPRVTWLLVALVRNPPAAEQRFRTSLHERPYL